MTKDLAIIIIAFFVAILSFLGFPGVWKMVLYGVSGLTIIVLTLLLRRDFLMRLTQKRKKKNGADAYIENGDLATPSRKNDEVSFVPEEGTAAKRLTVQNTESANN